MGLAARVQAILFKPKEEWIRIKAESLSISRLFSSYVLVLAVIPAASQFLRFSLIGFKVPYFGWYRFGIGMSFLRAMLTYVFNAALIYAFGLIINVLAPAFSSAKNMNKAMKLAAYSMTPYLVGSVLYIIPFLGRLDLLVSLYGVYLLYLGFTASLVDAPKEKAVGYSIVSAVAAGVLMAVVWLMLDTIFIVGRVSRVI